MTDFDTWTYNQIQKWRELKEAGRNAEADIISNELWKVGITVEDLDEE